MIRSITGLKQLTKLRGIKQSKALLWQAASYNTSSGGEQQADQLPRESQVVICGGGVLGCSVAYHLAKLGWTDVVVLEQGR